MLDNTACLEGSGLIQPQGVNRVDVRAVRSHVHFIQEHEIAHIFL